MQFLQPAALWGLLALLVPILIHLFKFRKVKKIIFSQTTFLKEVKEQNKSRQQLKRWLLLFTRLALILFLVLTFAQPFTSTQSQLATEVILYIDNSYSATNEVTEGISGLTSATLAAEKIVNQYPRGTLFYLVTNEFTAGQKFPYSQEIVLDKLTEIQPSGRSRSLPEVMDRIATRDESGEPTDLYVITDNQSSFISSATDIQPDSLLHINWVTVSYQDSKNLYVDSVYLNQPFLLPGQSNTLGFRVQNTGNSLAATQVKISLGDRLLATQTLDVPAKSSVNGTVPLQVEIPALTPGKLELTDYPITYDNITNFSLKPSDAIRVLELYSEHDTDLLSSVYGNEQLFTFRKRAVTNLNYSELKWADLIVLNQLANLDAPLMRQLSDLVQGGKALVVIPAENAAAAVQQLQSFGINAQPATIGKQRLQQPDRSNPFFTGIFTDEAEFTMPEASFTLRLPASVSAVYRGQAGMAYLAQQNSIWAFASPLMAEYTNFHRHALFLPTLYKIAFTSLQAETPLYYQTNQQTITLPLVADQGTSLVLSRNGVPLVPPQQQYDNRTLLSLPANEIQPGFYTLQTADSVRDILAFNLPESESVTQYLTSEQVEELFGNISNIKFFQVEEFSSAAKLQANLGATFLWKWTLLLALLCLLLEALIIRFLK